MKKSFFIALVCVSGLLYASNAKAQSMQETVPAVEVNASAEKEVAPDLFYLRVDIDESDTKGKRSLESQQKELVDILKAMGLRDALTRLSLQSSFSRKSNLSRAAFQIKITEAEKVSLVWQRLDEAGFSRVNFIKAEYSRIEQLRDEVRCQAVRNARDQAKAMAESIGQKIGKCFYINCGYSGGGVVYAQPRLMTKAVMVDSLNAAAESEENIDFNNIKVSANVSAKFVLQ